MATSRRARGAHELGREQDGLVQPMTLMFRMVQFERAAFEAYVRAHPEQWRGVHGLWDLIRKATAAGELDLPREDILFFGTPHEGEVSVNSTRVMRVLGTDVFDWSCAEVESRRQMRQIAAFLRRYVPGSSAPTSRRAGCTRRGETRRIVGDYQSPPRTCSRGASSPTWSRAARTRSTSTIPKAAARC